MMGERKRVAAVFSRSAIKFCTAICNQRRNAGMNITSRFSGRGEGTGSTRDDERLRKGYFSRG